MSTRPSTQELRQAFLAVNEAIDNLTVVKEHLIKLHYKSEEIDNSAFLVENHHRWAAPDSDSHDVLFARHERAVADLSTPYLNSELAKICEQMVISKALVEGAHKTFL